jgi:glucan phosphoethanolaminetransferase (alkaline phosphatase superfamily)
MGTIIFWSLIRFVFVLIVCYYFYDKFTLAVWSIVSLFLIFSIVFFPAYLKYQNFIEENKEICEHTLCSSCRHFDKTSVHCLLYDEKPSLNYLPCNGKKWELKMELIDETESL